MEVRTRKEEEPSFRGRRVSFSSIRLLPLPPPQQNKPTLELFHLQQPPLPITSTSRIGTQPRNPNLYPPSSSVRRDSPVFGAPSPHLQLDSPPSPRPRTNRNSLQSLQTSSTTSTTSHSRQESTSRRSSERGTRRRSESRRNANESGGRRNSTSLLLQLGPLDTTTIQASRFDHSLLQAIPTTFGDLLRRQPLSNARTSLSSLLLKLSRISWIGPGQVRTSTVEETEKAQLDRSD